MNEFKVGDIIRSNLSHNMFTYLVTAIYPKSYYYCQLLCLDTNQPTKLPYEYQYNYYVVERA